MKSGFRDKRYLGPALRVDLMDAIHETRRWSTSQLIIEAAPLVLQQGGVQEGRKLTGVFTFEGQKIHGTFEAAIAKRESDDGLVAADFEWISERGRQLLRTMAGQRRPEESGEPPTMKVNFTQSTSNWSLSGFLLDNYHGCIKSGDRFRGMIWMDKPQDPGLFGAHAIRVDKLRHTLSVKFDELPANTFALLEAVIKKSRVVPGKIPAHV
jgi:hypothetical protein